MKISISRDLNLNNLKFVAERLAGIEYSIFFGTLLGFQREANIIEHDDDIDIYVNSLHREEILDIFSGSELVIKPELPRNSSPCFLQGVRIFEQTRTFVDFYFYEENKEHDYIIERWNFSGRWNNPNNTMHVPKDYFYPIQAANMQGIDLKVPAAPNELCAFLYGDRWEEPMSKGSQYRMGMRNNRPKMILIDDDS